jgi:hypothetical protein
VIAILVAMQKRTENAFKAPCCGPSPLVVLVWRQILDYEFGARTYPVAGCQFSGVGSRNGSEMAM